MPGQSRIDGVFVRRAVCLRTLVVVWMLGWVMHGSGAGVARGDDPALEHALQALPALQEGENLSALRPIGQAVSRSHDDAALRRELETRLLAVIQGEATDLAKDYACRQLVILGSDEAVPALAGLLASPRLSHMSRYALEGIGGAAARNALRDALPTTKGRQRVGVVISLGRLADADAVAMISELLAQQDDALHEAAVVALGRIGTIDAAAAIQAFQERAPQAMRGAVSDALLHAAQRLAQQGDRPAAADIYESLMASSAERIGAAGFRGLIQARPENAAAMILDGLADVESWKRAVAADCLVELREPDAVDAIAAAIPDLPVPGQLAAFGSLKDHPRPAVRSAALWALRHATTPVRVAALDALVQSATAEDVALLASLIADSAEDQAVRDTADRTLRLMPDDGMSRALSDWMDGVEDLAAEVVRCALARRDPDTVPAFLNAAAGPRAETRLAALQALEILACERHVDALIALLCRAEPAEEREAAGRAVWMSCQKIADPAQRSAPVLAALERADATGQAALLPVVARMGGQAALAAVHAAMRDSDRTVRDAGYRALANWPDAGVADELLAIARTHAVESYRIWALRAYARVVALPSDRPAEETFQLLHEAMTLAERQEDQELFVNRLGAVRAPEALDRLLELLERPQLREAAVPAIFELAKGLSQSHPQQARDALERIESLTTDPALLQQIPKVLRDIENRE